MQLYFHCQNLNNLPFETLGLICECLSLTERRALRLTNRNVGGVADRYAFPRLKCYILPQDFAMVRRFANYPAIAANVKELEYSTEVLPQPFVTFGDFNKRHSGVPGIQWNAPSASESPKEMKLWLQYLNEDLGQRRILTHGLDYELFRDILPKFTGLRGVLVTLQARVDGLIRKTPFSNLFWDPRNRSESEPDSMRHVNAVVSSLSEASPRLLRHLELRRLCPNFLLQLEDPTRLQYISKLFQNLTALELHLDLGFAWRDRDDGILAFSHQSHISLQKGHLLKLITSMSKLEELRFGFVAGRPPGLGSIEAPARFIDVLPTSLCFRNIKTIFISTFEVFAEELLGFLTAHRLTLRYVWLRSAWIHAAPWRVFIRQVRELVEKSMLVDELQLLGCSGSVFGHQELDSHDEELATGNLDTSGVEGGKVEDKEGAGNGVGEETDKSDAGPQPRVEYQRSQEAYTFSYKFPYPSRRRQDH